MVTVVATFALVPAAIWYWQDVAVPHRYPAGTHLVTLTAVADGGIWTREHVVGANYWRGRPQRVGDIHVKEGEHVVVRLRSADVLHSFAIPRLHLGPVEIPAGSTVEVSFDADRPGILTFLCWQVCSPDHGSLRGRFVVDPAEDPMDR